MTNEDIIKVAQAAMIYFTTSDMSEEEEQEFLDYYYEFHLEEEMGVR